MFFSMRQCCHNIWHFYASSQLTTIHYFSNLRQTIINISEDFFYCHNTLYYSLIVDPTQSFFFLGPHTDKEKHRPELSWACTSIASSLIAKIEQTWKCRKCIWNKSIHEINGTQTKALINSMLATMTRQHLMTKQ